jgi:putative PEP-CTERM system TPR-repeat lipoprotein
LYKKILIVLTIAVFFIGGCTNTQRTKEELLSDGLRLMNEEKQRRAIIFFKNALEKDPNFFEARYELGKAYVSLGKLDYAEKELQKVKRQVPSSKNVRVELARVYLEKSRPEEGLKEIAEFIDDTSNNADVLEIAGWAYALKGDYATALSLLKRTLATDSGTLSGHITLARVYAKMEKYEKAKARLTKILKKEPSNRDVLYLLAELLIKQNDIDTAFRTYERILKNYPSDITALLRTGSLYLAKSDYEEALLIAEKLINLKRPEGHRLKGIVYFYEQRFDDAIISLQKSLSVKPDVGTYYFLGLCHYEKNELEQANSNLQKALDIKSSFVQARVFVSLILLRQKRIDSAISEIKRVLENEDGNALAHNILGSAYMAKGMFDEGIETLNRAIEIDPKLVNVYLNKGLFELSVGNFEEAKNELKTALKADPELLYSRVILASYYIRQNKYSKAIKILDDGIKGQDTDGVFYNLIADALARQNKAIEAIHYLEKAKASNPNFDAPYYRLASLHILRGEHDRGIQELRSLIRKSPDNLKALLTVASILESTGKKEEALYFFIKARRTEKATGYIGLAKYYLREKDPDKALKVLEDAIMKNPSDTLPYEFRGKVLLSLNRVNDAIKTFEDIKRINPKLGLTYIVNAYTSINKHEKALNRIRRELKKNPDNLDLMAEISRLYKTMGKKKDAIEAAEHIIHRKPELTIGYIALATIYQNDNELDEAIKVLKNAQRTKDSDIVTMLGDLYFLKKDYTSALEQYREAEKINPVYIQAIFRHGSVLQAMGKKKEAIKKYQKVLMFSQNNVPALNNLAYLYAEGDRDLAAALQLASRAYILSPNDGYVLDTFGFVLLKKGKGKEGLKALKKALERVHDSPAIYYHLALAYMHRSYSKS